MIDKNSKNVNYLSQFGILIGLTGGGFIVSLVLSVVIWLVMVGTTFPSKAEDILQLKYYNVNMVLQVVTTFFIFFAPVYFFALICYRKPFKYLGYNFHINNKQIFLVLGILLITFPLAGALGELNKILPIPQNWMLKFKAAEVAREAQEAALIQINTLPKYFISLFVIALLPAIFEETFFRAGMQTLFIKWFKSPWGAIILTSIIFSVIHLSYYGFLVRFALGVILGLIYYYGRSLWLSILFHFLFNGLQVTALYVISLKGLSAKKDLEDNFPVWLGIIAFVILIYLFIHYKRISNIEQAKFVEDDTTPADEFSNWVNSSS